MRTERGTGRRTHPLGGKENRSHSGQSAPPPSPAAASKGRHQLSRLTAVRPPSGARTRRQEGQRGAPPLHRRAQGSRGGAAAFPFLLCFGRRWIEERELEGKGWRGGVVSNTGRRPPVAGLAAAVDRGARGRERRMNLGFDRAGAPPGFDQARITLDRRITSDGQD